MARITCSQLPGILICMQKVIIVNSKKKIVKKVNKLDSQNTSNVIAKTESTKTNLRIKSASWHS